MKEGLAPHPSAVFGAGLDSKFIDCVGLQIVDDCVFSRACLVVPLPVLLAITYRVMSKQRTCNTLTVNPSLSDKTLLHAWELRSYHLILPEFPDVQTFVETLMINLKMC